MKAEYKLVQTASFAPKYFTLNAECMFFKRRYSMSEYFVANIRKSLPVLSLKFTQTKVLLNLRLSRLLRRQNPLLTQRDHLALWPKNRRQDLPQSYPFWNRNDSCKL